jgi:hypothetical protein
VLHSGGLRAVAVGEDWRRVVDRLWWLLLLVVLGELERRRYDLAGVERPRGGESCWLRCLEFAATAAAGGCVVTRGTGSPSGGGASSRH